MNIYTKIIHIMNAVFFLLPLQVYASEEKANAENLVNTSSAIKHDAMDSSYLLQLVIGLFIVLICIVALAWITKKINRFKLLSDDSLKIVGGLSMGARERVVLLQVGTEQLLLGVSPGRISTLHVLDKPIETISKGNSEDSFARCFSDKLKKVVRDASDKTDKQQSSQAMSRSHRTIKND